MLKANILIFTLITAHSIAADAILPPDLHQMREEGFNNLFNMKYAEAKATFEKMIETHPDHPAGYVYLGNAIWLGHLGELRRLQTGIYNRGDSFFDEKANDAVDPEVDREFNKNVKKAIALTEASLKKNKKDLNAMYYQGIAKNLIATYDATVKRKFFSALRNGSKGVGLHRTIIKRDPKFIDAYLSVAMYEYITGSLPFAVKILVFFGGIHGSKKEGLKALEKTYREGMYAKDEAGILLVMLYKREKRMNDALKVLNEMCNKFPDNVLLFLERSMTLAELKKFEESYSEFDAMLQNEKAMGYMPDLVHYQYGEALTDSGEWERARVQYQEAYTLPKTPEGMKTKALLRIGQCHDALGQRDLALEQYRLVLKRRNMFDSHELAKRFTKKPFQPRTNTDSRRH